MVAPWPAGGPQAWVGIPDMATLIARLAVSRAVKWQTFVNGIMRTSRGEWRISTDHGCHSPFDAVITAVPPEQAVPFLALHDLEMARTASSEPCRPCWAGLFVFASAVPAASLVFRKAGPIALAVCNRAKPMRTKPEAWLLHADPAWSEAHLEREPDDIVTMLRVALQDALEIPALPAHEAIAHRWRYASAPGVGRMALWNADLKLGACGDWLIGPGAECAWTSGRALGRLVNSTFNLATAPDTSVETVLEKDSPCVS